ncbi:uncharacterized protein B0H64DRAFT_478603 [Chaetomium fimeti]|uniref:TauD/TfdA-like domain-containing protein n=1 Tax=Chaetomium fimeti TaxID=1854472 RepID=A0AAE0LN71_9PEZI|nr:hypothetical protein B0H64DRAFT_478603 [Chaetomium fimeti]
MWSTCWCKTQHTGWALERGGPRPRPLRAPNSDELLRDLATTISQRGVVFFRSQDSLTDDLQKELFGRLGKLSGKPEADIEITVISSKQSKKLYADRLHGASSGGKHHQTGKNQRHPDITFEAVPSDHALLRLTQLPQTGGATYAQPLFNEAATPQQLHPVRRPARRARQRRRHPRRPCTPWCVPTR